jgi:DNA-binding transcriptional ArsR family regulator
VVKQLDAVYGALADATRRSMVERLRQGELSVSALGEPYPMTLAAIGKHVAVLEAAGIVRTRKTGRVRSCALVPRALDDASAWMREQESFWNDRLDALTTYLEETP